MTVLDETNKMVTETIDKLLAKKDHASLKKVNDILEERIPNPE